MIFNRLNNTLQEFALMKVRHIEQGTDEVEYIIKLEFLSKKSNVIYIRYTFS